MPPLMNHLLARHEDESDQEQLEELQQEFLWQLNLGSACDQLPGAVGDFGRDLGNPVPVNGVRGELKYLNRLVCPCGCHLLGHRLGSRALAGIAGNIDIYETVCSEGRHWDLLVVHPYHPRRSHRAPADYSFAPFHPQISRTTIGMVVNHRCADFPLDLIELANRGLPEEMRQRIVAAMAPALVAGQPYARPPEQRERLERLEQQGGLSGMTAQP